MNFKILSVSLLAFLIVGVFACKNDPEEPAVSESRYEAMAENYASIVLASYNDALEAAVVLNDLIDAFVANPSEAAFTACKDQWLAARRPYGQTEAYRFYGGPIDGEDGPEGLINAWPMDELFIDYVESDATSGLINDPTTYPDITKEALMDLNEAISETSIFTGYHAIEFLLWGQDLYADSPGQRQYTDYVVGGTAENQDRRGLYLQTVSELLVDHLTEVRDQWTATGAYRASFLALDKETILDYLFTSLGEMSKGELSGERMFVAVDEQDQEFEHSCFSDNTHVDIQENFMGMVNVFNGTYTRSNGTVITGESLAAITSEFDSQKAVAVENAILAAQQSIDAIPVPFDQAIINSSQSILDAVEALQELGDAFADAEVELP